MNFKLCMALFAGIFFSLSTFAQETGIDAGAGSDFLVGLFLPFLFFVFISGLGAVYVISLVWTSVNRKNWKILWTVVPIVLGVFGTIFYFLIGSKSRLASQKEIERKNAPKPVRERPAHQKPSPMPVQQRVARSTAPAHSPSPFFGFPKQAPKPVEQKKGFFGFSKTEPKQAVEERTQENPLYSSADYSAPKKAVGFVQGPQSGFTEKKLPSAFPASRENERQGILDKLKDNLAFGGTPRQKMEEEMRLSPDELEEADHLVSIIGKEANHYSREEILSVVLEKGYTLNVARKVVKDLFK